MASKLQQLVLVVLLAAAASVALVSASRPKAPMTQADVDEFQDWFASNGGWHHANITYEFVDPETAEDAFQVPKPYMRVMATGAVKPKEVLFSVPEKLLLFVPTQLREEKFPRDWSEMECLTYMLAEEVRNPDSKWAPYFNVLPREFDTPLHWDEAQVALLSETAQYGFAGNVAMVERSNFAHFVERVPAIHNSKWLKWRLFPRALLRWCWSVVASRAFHIKESAEHPLSGATQAMGRPVLAPGADFLNYHVNGHIKLNLTADDALAASVQFNEDGEQMSAMGVDPETDEPQTSLEYMWDTGRHEFPNSFQVVAMTGYGAGMEVFYNYHRMPNAYMLSNYGFLPDNNPYDYLKLKMRAPLLDGTELLKMKVQMLMDMGLDDTVELRPSGMLHRTMNILRVLGLNRIISQAEHDELIVENPDREVMQVDEETEARGLGLAVAALEQLAEQYDSNAVYTKYDISREEEARWLQDPDSFGEDERFEEWNDAPHQTRLALRARLLEREMVSKTMEYIEELRSRLSVRIDVDLDETMAELKRRRDRQVQEGGELNEEYEPVAGKAYDKGATEGEPEEQQ